MHHVKNPAELLRQSPAEAVANSVYTPVVLTGHTFFLNNLSGSATATGAIAIPVAVRLGRGFPAPLRTWWLRGWLRAASSRIAGGRISFRGT